MALSFSLSLSPNHNTTKSAHTPYPTLQVQFKDPYRYKVQRMTFVCGTLPCRSAAWRAFGYLAQAQLSARISARSGRAAKRAAVLRAFFCEAAA